MAQTVEISRPTAVAARMIGSDAPVPSGETNPISTMPRATDPTMKLGQAQRQRIAGQRAGDLRGGFCLYLLGLAALGEAALGRHPLGLGPGVLGRHRRTARFRLILLRRTGWHRARSVAITAPSR